MMGSSFLNPTPAGKYPFAVVGVPAVPFQSNQQVFGATPVHTPAEYDPACRPHAFQPVLIDQAALPTMVGFDFRKRVFSGI